MNISGCRLVLTGLDVGCLVGLRVTGFFVGLRVGYLVVGDMVVGLIVGDLVDGLNDGNFVVGLDVGDLVVGADDGADVKVVGEDEGDEDGGELPSPKLFADCRTYNPCSIPLTRTVPEAK